jgi:phosphatidylglycerol:prolipoprotein diacylglycerol transferase
MIPILFELGSIKVYSYGLMLGIGFLLGSFALAGEFRRRGIDPAMANTITVLAVVFGIGGAKILFLLEEWNDFIRDPVGMAFSPGGLTWYGGFILAMGVVFGYIRHKKVSFLKVWDCLGIALMLGYGVGRLGCHFSGDGDYGTPTTLPWGTIYAQGIAKPSVMLQDYFDRNPDQRAAWNYDSLRVIPAGVDRLNHRFTRFDAITPLHPAPVYECILGILGFIALRQLNRRRWPDGKLFMIYLMLSSVFRFLIETIRLNPKIFAGLTEAQLFAVVIFLLGLGGMLFLDSRVSAETSGPS